VAAIEAVKTKEADVAVSAGNTGALMAMAKFCLRTMANIERPAIAAIWPTMKGESIVLDVGATIGADSQQLMDFALMGGAMARALFEVERPTVGLLNVGVEEIKGQEEVKEAGRLLREANIDSLEYSASSKATTSAREPSMSWSPKALPAISRSRLPRARPARSPNICGGDVAHAARQDRLSLRQERLRHAAREDGSEQGQRRRVPRPERRRHQEPRRRQCRRFRLCHRGRLRHGQEWPQSEDRKRFAKVSCQALPRSGRKRHDDRI
jgi:hypothetical protein